MANLSKRVAGGAILAVIFLCATGGAGGEWRAVRELNSRSSWERDEDSRQ